MLYIQEVRSGVVGDAWTGRHDRLLWYFV